MFIIIFLIFEAIACYSFFFWKLKQHPNHIINGIGFLLGYIFFAFLFGWTQRIIVDPATGFFIPFILFALVGGLYVFLKRFLWEELLSFKAEMLFVLGNLFLGAAMWISFGFIFDNIPPSISYPFAFSSFGFSIPLIIFKFWKRIATKEEKSCNPFLNGYPVMEIENTQTVTFLISKYLNSKELFSVTVRAPINQPISKVFHYLLHNMRERDSENHPSIANNWRFYLKADHWWQANKKLEFEQTMVQNDIAKYNNIIIIAERVVNHDQTNIIELSEVTEKNEALSNDIIKPNRASYVS